MLYKVATIITKVEQSLLSSVKRSEWEEWMNQSHNKVFFSYKSFESIMQIIYYVHVIEIVHQKIIKQIFLNV